MHSSDPSRSAGGIRHLRSRWRLLAERKLWLALLVAVSVGSAALVTWLLRPVYEGETTMRIDETQSMSMGLSMGRIAGSAGGMGSLPGLGGDGKLKADILVLHSRNLAEQVVDSLDLHVALASPRLPRSAVLTVLEAPRDARAATYELRRRPDGTYTLRGGGVAGASGTAVQVGRPFRAGDLVLALQPGVADEAFERIAVEVEPFRRTVEDLQEDLQVFQPDPDAPILSVRYRSTDPFLAASVPNAMTARFINYKTGVAKSEGRTTIDFLEGQLGTYRAQLTDAEAALGEYRREATVINPTAQSEEQVKQLAQLQSRKSELSSEVSSLRSLLARLSSPTGTPGSQLAAYRQLAAFPAFLMNASVQAIFASLIELENERAELMVLRTEKNTDVQARTERIAHLELQLLQLARSYLQSLESQLASVDAELSKQDAALVTIPAREVEFYRRARQQALLEQVYTLLETRLKEAEIKAAGEPTGVRIIDAALIPDEPLFPNLPVNLGLAVIVGLIVGVGVVLGREMLNPVVRSREDVLESTTGAPVLGQIPAMRITGISAEAGRPWRRVKVAVQNAPTTKLASWSDPRSPASEAYRALSTSLTQLAGAPSLLLVTSAASNEGSESSAANLAWAIAQRGTRTLLVEADLREESVLRHLVGAAPQPGLADVLAGRSELLSAVQEIRDGRQGSPLSFLSAGNDPDAAADLLGSDRMRQLLAEASEHYQMVILHAPPLGATIDAELLGRQCGATILVARSGVTQKETLQLAAGRLARLEIPLLGVILNDAEFIGRDDFRNNRLAYT